MHSTTAERAAEKASRPSNKAVGWGAITGLLVAAIVAVAVLSGGGTTTSKPGVDDSPYLVTVHAVLNDWDSDDTYYVGIGHEAAAIVNAAPDTSSGYVDAAVYIHNMTGADMGTAREIVTQAVLAYGQGSGS